MLPTKEYLEECFQLLDDGTLLWKERPRSHFKSDHAWVATNTQRGGKEAGRISVAGYRQIGLDYRMYYAHRIVWVLTEGVWPKEWIDHINRDRLDNRRSNLRDTSTSENQANTKMRSNNASGFRGVSTSSTPDGKWRANICIRGNRRYLGRFETKEAAAAAYRKAFESGFPDTVAIQTP